MMMEVVQDQVIMAETVEVVIPDLEIQDQATVHIYHIPQLKVLLIAL